MKRAIAALSVAAMVGCGTAHKKPIPANTPPDEQQPSTEAGTGSRAAKGAVGGAAFGAGMCLSLIPMGLIGGGPLGLIMVPVAVACLPVGAVAGAVVGGTAVAVSDAARNAGASTSQIVPHAAPSAEDSAWKLIGRLEANEAIPAGTLHFASAHRKTENQPAIKLLVDFDNPSERGERSYMAYATVSCQRGLLSFHSRETYSEWGANGSRITSEFLNDGALFVIDKANDAFAQVFQQACE